MRTALNGVVLGASLAGCAAIGPMNETERASIRAVAPVRAQFVPVVDFRLPPGKGAAAKSGAVGGVLGAVQPCAYAGPFFFACMAVFGTAGAVAGAAVAAVVTPSEEGVEASVAEARAALGDVDVQHLIVKKFAEGTARLTPFAVLPASAAGGPRSAVDRPTYAGAGYAQGTVVAEVYVSAVGATLVDITGFSQTEYKDRRPRIGLVAQLRLVRPSDGATLMARRYRVLRFGRRITEYDGNPTLLVKALAGAVDEAATQMVDDAFLLHQGSASASAEANRPTWNSAWVRDTAEQSTAMTRITPLEPMPSGSCFVHSSFDCWLFNRVPQLDTQTPRFRWAPFQREARNLVYDLWVFGAEENRLVEGLQTTEYRFEAPFPACARFSWAVRARFDTPSGPRAVEWSSASSFAREDLEGGTERPTFAAPFVTPCAEGGS